MIAATMAAATEPLPPLDALLREAWQRIAERADAALPWLQTQADAWRADARAQGWLAMFEARSRWTRGERALAKTTLARAQALLADDRDGQLACLDARCWMAFSESSDDEQLLAWLAPVMPTLGADTPAVLRRLLWVRQGGVLMRLQREDEGLRAFHLGLAAAREAGIPSLLATALASLGGAHCSLGNPEEGLPLCEEAWALCPQPGAKGAVRPNLMSTLSAVGRHDEAITHAQALLDCAPGAKVLALCALVFDRAGQPQRAAALLEQAQASAEVPSETQHELVWLQARQWRQQGRPADALACVEQHLAHGGRDSLFPVDRLELHREAALAAEALGDLHRALHHQRQSHEAQVQSLRQAAMARRVSLQVRLELDMAHAQRDAALQREQALAVLNRALREAGEAKTRFLAAASHDLRQPVHALILQAAALRPQLDTPRQREMLAGIERCAASLGGLFDALLDLARLDAGALQPRREAVNLGPLLAGLVEELLPQAEAKGLRLALRLSSRAPAWVDSDPHLLATVLRNLLGNALRYTARGGVLVGVRARRGPGGAAGWCVQVWDTGVGIAPEHQAQVFEEFFQVDNPARQRERGIGLGLSIVRRLGTLLDMPLRLRSRPGQGTCVELQLGAWLAPLPDAAGGSGLPVLPPGLKVALLEDDPEVRAATESLLTAWGCQVRSADGVRALQAACTGWPPDRLLSDLRLPGVQDGVAAVAALRQAWQLPALPALILTGDLGAPTMQRLAATDLAWLPKPVPLARLAAWLLRAA
ncbi:ATP-binding response regulator [Ideonella alba]|uniref:histidine kinase n=1 Tax=Ideonella alba TaxID=2824118 RepID=A0A940YCP0_9BURK|nr:hybrid sensor histidine kinase/response regulator [Ideonella alba]MBQ0930686.1 hybrid sensor histidine kinase/response regulator [Ideonella alba]